MAGAGRVGVGQFIHQHQLWMAPQHGVDVHFGKLDGAVGDLQAWNDLQPADQFFGLGPPVGLDVADHDVHPLLFPLVGGLQHGIRFSDPGRVAQEDLQPAAVFLLLLGLDLGQQLVGVGAGIRILGRHALYAICLILSHPVPD